MRAKDAVGQYGERVAAQHLMDTGLQIIERNWRCSAGEIDIVAAEGGTLVFVEVKARSSLAFGSPAQAVVGRKQRRVRELALHWLDEHPGSWAELRFDVVSVLRMPRGPAEVEHLRGAF
jgi:putative endonuclease